MLETPLKSCFHSPVMNLWKSTAEAASLLRPHASPQPFESTESCFSRHSSFQAIAWGSKHNSWRDSTTTQMDDWGWMNPPLAAVLLYRGALPFPNFFTFFSLYSSFPARTHNWLWQQLMHCTAVSLKRGKQDFATTEQKHHTTAQNIIGFKRWQKYEKMALGKPLPFAKCQLCYSKPLRLKLSFGIFIDNFFDISNPLPLTFHLIW